VSHFFISYSRKNSADVEKLELKMQEEGILVWTDRRIEAGEEWRKMIDLAIEDSIGVILIVSEYSIKSKYVDYEWSYAMGKGKKIIPVAIDVTSESDDDVHPKLSPIQWIKVLNDPLGWQDELVDKLKHLAGVVEDFPPHIQNAVKLFDSLEKSDWKKAVEFLKQNRSPYAIDALALGCHHDTYGVREACGLYFVRNMDKRGIPIIEEIYGTLEVKRTSNPSHLPFIRKFKISSVQKNIIDFIEHSDRKHAENPTKYDRYANLNVINRIIATLEHIITEDGIEELRSASVQLESDGLWKRQVDSMLSKFNAE